MLNTKRGTPSKGADSYIYKDGKGNLSIRVLVEDGGHKHCIRVYAPKTTSRERLRAARDLLLKVMDRFADKWTYHDANAFACKCSARLRELYEIERRREKRQKILRQKI